MNQFYYQKNAFGAHEERCDSFSFSGQESVVCPKPRRFGVLSNIPNRSLRRHVSHAIELSDSRAGAELLDIFLMKEGYGLEQTASQVASSPPFFCGSPPSRAVNPIVQDARFGDEIHRPMSSFQMPPPSVLPSPLSSARKPGCARMNSGLKPATIRVEGFDCLNRDRQNSSIPAMA